jgi:hypothetical protein
MMHKEVIINSDFVSFMESEGRKDGETVPMKRQGLISTTSFGDGLMRQLSNPGIIPPGTRYTKQYRANSRLFIVEQPPSIRTVRINYDPNILMEKLKRSGKLEEYGYKNFDTTARPFSVRLSFPFIVFVIVLNKRLQLEMARLYFRMHPITGMGDYLFKAPLLNVSKEQTICLGSAPKGEDKPTNLNEAVMSVINTFWLNEFNSDYTDNVKEYEKVGEWGISDVLTWAYNSKMDPMFIYKVKWLPIKESLGQVIQIIDRSFSGNDVNIFNSIIDAVKLNKTEIDKKTGQQIVTGISNQVSIEGYTLEIGEEVEFDKIKYNVISFKGPLGKSPTKVFLESSEGGIIEKNIDSVFIKSIIKQIGERGCVESIKVGEKTIKIGDILKVHFAMGSKFKSVQKIRKARDGRAEIQFNDKDYYIIENIKYDIIDFDKIEINGTVIKEGVKYIVLKAPSNRNGFINVQGTVGEFVGHEVVGENINIKFSDKSLVPLSTKDYKVIEYEEQERPNVLRVLDSLITNHLRNKDTYILKDVCLIRPPGVEASYQKAMAKAQILDDVKKPTTVILESYDLDITFKVGDTVIVANWTNEETIADMTTIFKIASMEFTSKDSEEILQFKLKNSRGKVVAIVDYINFDKGRINLTGVRKICTKPYYGIQAGTKIRCKTSGIMHFPKKDVSTVIGFIHNCGTKDPLMLCSNGFTLWANKDVLSLFEKSKPGTETWKKLKNSPISVDKAKFQSGDTLVFNDDKDAIFILGFGEDIKNIRLFSLNPGYGLGWSEEYDLEFINKYFTRIGVLSPRYSLVDYSNFEIRRGFPNLQGGLVPSDLSRFGMREVWEHV